MSEPTKPKRTWTEDEVRHKLATSNVFLERAIKRLYDLQTPDEKMWGPGKGEHNGKGFNRYDAPILSALAVLIYMKGNLPEGTRIPKWEIDNARHRMKKYAGQLTKIANAQPETEE